MVKLNNLFLKYFGTKLQLASVHRDLQSEEKKFNPKKDLSIDFEETQQYTMGKRGSK